MPKRTVSRNLDEVCGVCCQLIQLLIDRWEVEGSLPPEAKAMLEQLQGMLYNCVSSETMRAMATMQEYAAATASEQTAAEEG